MCFPSFLSKYSVFTPVTEDRRTDTQRRGSLQRYSMRAEELKNRELRINDSDQLLAVRAQVSCLTEFKAVGCVTQLCVGDSYCETENLGRMFFSFSNTEKFMLLCLLANAEQDEKMC